MSIVIEKTNFNGLCIIKPHVFNDERGAYIKYFQKTVFENEHCETTFSEYSEINAKKGSLRGLHFQICPPQGKLIRVVKGKVFDVAVDIRKDSETFGKAFTIYLNADEKKAVYIPSGFAHGFLALEDSIFIYESSGVYNPDSSGVILWNDLELNINWPIKGLSLIISEKDKNGTTMSDFRKALK